MTEDQHLLQRYVRHAMPEALDELVRRYRDLVYSSALRQVRDPHLAEDVAQAVFIILSKKASTIRQGVALGGWLLAVTRRAALNAMKKQAIQHRHERAAAKTEAFETAEANWEQIDPVLDSVMSRLPRVDRDAVVLRFFQQRSFAQVGAELGLSEEAARKRVQRAIERMRGLLSHRGTTLGGAALGTMITAHAVHAAPVTLTISLTAAPSGAMGIAKGAIHTMAWAKAKVAAVVVLTSIFAVAGGAVVVTYALAQQQQPNPPAVNQPQAAAEDRAAIQGTWQLILTLKNGKPELNPTGKYMVIAEKEIVISKVSGISAPMQYEIDSSHEPKWFTIKLPTGHSMLGIYDLNGDSLRLCMSNNETTRPRPTQFASELNGPDLMVFHRGAPTTRATVAASSDDRLITAAKTDIANLETALDAFEIDTGRYPTLAEGLEALTTAPPTVRNWRGPYFIKVVGDTQKLDPWQQPYRYLAPGIHNKIGFDLSSAGPDGIDGTDDDITNWGTN